MIRSFSPQARAGVIFGALSCLLLFSFNNCSNMNSYSEEVTGVDGGFAGLASMATAGYCLFNGMPMKSGDSVVAYLSDRVPNGQSCVAQTRVCDEGTLTGSYTQSFCATDIEAGSCVFNKELVAPDTYVKAFYSTVAPIGQLCSEQYRRCVEGSLSGSFTAASCQVAVAGQSCSFDGITVASGASVSAYALPSVATGETCASVTRTCTSGIMGGSAYHTFSSCKVLPPAQPARATRAVYSFDFRNPYKLESTNRTAIPMDSKLAYYLFPSEVVTSFPLYICSDIQKSPGKTEEAGAAYRLLQRECTEHQRQMGIAGYVSAVEAEGLVPLYEYQSPEIKIQFDGDPGTYYMNINTHLLEKKTGGYIIGYVRRP